MQQRIGFCSTADGARIAYATVGAGPALVYASAGIFHLELDWEEPRVRDFWETINSMIRVRTGCHRGQGVRNVHREARSTQVGETPILPTGSGKSAEPCASYHGIVARDFITRLVRCQPLRPISQLSRSALISTHSSENLRSSPRAGLFGSETIQTGAWVYFRSVGIG